MPPRRHRYGRRCTGGPPTSSPATAAAAARHAAAVEDWPRAARALILAAEQTRARYALADAESKCWSDALAAAQRAADPELVGRAHLARGQVPGSPAGLFGPAASTTTRPR